VAIKAKIILTDLNRGNFYVSVVSSCKKNNILTPGGSTMDGSSYSYKIKIKVQDLSYRRITGLTDLIGSL